MGNLPLPIAAFVAGLASFLTPCVLPLVPGYVSLISGVGIEELKMQEASVLRKVMLNSLAFVLGFSIVFVTLGALSTEVGQLASQYKATLAQVAGVLVILFGAELNSEIEHQTARDSTVDGNKPLGARGAVMADTVGDAA